MGDNSRKERVAEAAAKDRAEPGFIPPEMRENPYSLPRKFLNNGLTIYGARVINFLIPGDISLRERVDQIRATNIRDDDVVLTAFPKSGTHWLCEVLHMLVNNTTKPDKRSKEHSMLELATAEYVESLSSPRVLNTHLWMGHLPREVFLKKIKIVHVVRNPKDTFVSYYHHYKNIAEPGYSLDGFLQALVQNDQLQVENQFEHLRHMSEFQRNNPDHPIKVVYYEDMKKDPVAGIQDLAEFLQISRSRQFYEAVAEACSFDSMKKAEKQKDKPEVFKKAPVKMYRKGVAGDWKTQLTVAQNERLDQFIASEMKKGGLDYKFIYE